MTDAATKVSKWLIYGLVDPRTDEVRYIGKSSYGMSRPRQHLRKAGLSERNHKANWVRSLLAGGLEPVIRVLEYVSSPDDLNDVERFWIAQGHGLGWRLTNLTKGGDGLLGHRHMPETLAKMSAKSKGRRLSAEAKAKISAANTGRVRSPEVRAAVVARNKQLVKEGRYKLKPWPVGTKHKEETKAKISAANKGKARSAEHSRNISLAKMGKKHTPESRARMAAGQLKRWAALKAAAAQLAGNLSPQ